ncbi:alpha-amylase family glycosyl hydrolase [Microbacterium suaedae]|uniref:alpha-amylase family glycosyl hydrolase n=1 Tax=Microbacterium suaedae TaxID=2067813 RepID=UPI000DA25915|nr:alpha-amylase family glycosyl hydrolase [Microbacterium suaedae]
MNADRSRALRDLLGTLLAPLYGDGAPEVRDQLLALADRWEPQLSQERSFPLSHETAYLIAYGDSFTRDGEVPLHTLAGVLREHVGDILTDVHLLPIYPWTSDDGFAVVDHREVDPALGTWADVEETESAGYQVALDFVANHVSASNPWFRGWLDGDKRYDGYFLEPAADFDTAQVVRPRATPLLHPFERADGTTAKAWTTFGPDQIDVDPRTPSVLLELTDVLLGYIARGARTIRLDAIGFLWKESGTSSIHLPQTHAVVKVWRALIDAVAPGVLLLTETNVPHVDNISYFGDGDDEANMVYQFALPPLVLHAFITGRATAFADWASGIRPVSDTATWFNFLSSHDGIGLRPTTGLLTDDDRRLMVERTLARGGRISMATQPDGSETVYELNTNYLDALVEADHPDPTAAVVQRGLAAHAILLSVVGVPAIYYHSLLGSAQDLEGVQESGIARRINRERLDADVLAEELETSPRRRGVFEGLRRLFETRRGLPGFSPFADQEIERHDERLVVIRRAGGTPDEIVAVINVSGDRVEAPSLSGIDVLAGRRHDVLALGPYEYVWLRRLAS